MVVFAWRRNMVRYPGGLILPHYDCVLGGDPPSVPDLNVECRYGIQEIQNRHSFPQ